MTRLAWSQTNSSTDGRFCIQTEHVREEGVCNWVMLDHERIDLAREHDIETCFFGRGSLARAKAAAQRLADILDSTGAGS